MKGFGIAHDPTGGVREGYKRLAAGIVSVTYKDFFKAKDFDTFLDCLVFLGSPAARLFLDSLEMVDQHPLKPIVDGKRLFEERAKVTNRSFRIRK